MKKKRHAKIWKAAMADSAIYENWQLNLWLEMRAEGWNIGNGW